MMNDRTSRFAFWAACVVAPLAVIGSAASLYTIAVDARLAVPVTLPVALDLTALVAAAQIRARRHLVLAWVTLVTGVAVSAALQVADAWGRGPSAWVVHGALPLAALVTFELAMPSRHDRHPPAAAAGDTAQGDAPDPEPPGPVELPAPPPAAEPEVAPTPLTPRPAEPRKAPAPRRPAAARAAATIDELVGAGRDIADGLGVAPWELSRRQLQDGLKALDPPIGIGTAKAAQVLEFLKRLPDLQRELNRLRDAGELVEVGDSHESPAPEAVDDTEPAVAAELVEVGQ